MASVNRLSTDKRARIIGCLVEGNSIRATVRMTEAAKDTITKLLVDLGKACAEYQDEALRDLPGTTTRAGRPRSLLRRSRQASARPWNSYSTGEPGTGYGGVLRAAGLVGHHPLRGTPAHGSVIVRSTGSGMTSTFVRRG
jgi:hypothetical protein